MTTMCEHASARIRMRIGAITRGDYVARCRVCWLIGLDSCDIETTDESARERDRLWTRYRDSPASAHAYTIDVTEYDHPLVDDDDPIEGMLVVDEGTAGAAETIIRNRRVGIGWLDSLAGADEHVQHHALINMHAAAGALVMHPTEGRFMWRAVPYEAFQARAPDEHPSEAVHASADAARCHGMDELAIVLAQHGVHVRDERSLPF